MLQRANVVIPVAEALVFGLLAIAALQKIIDFDIWYHLAIGREIAATGSIPAHEFLVFPNAGQPGAFHEWGYGLLFHLVHEAGGFRAMSVLNALFVCVTLWLLFRAADRRPWSSPAHLLVLLAVYLWMDFRLIYRPEMLLYLAMAAELLLLERYCESRRARWLLPVPLIGLLLSQAHPSVLILVAILGAYSAQLAWWAGRATRRPGDVLRAIRWPLMIAAATLVLATANPYGIEQVMIPLSFAAQQKVLSAVAEFTPVFESVYAGLFVAMCVIALVALAVTPERRVVDCLLLLAFGFLAFRHARNVAMFALVMYVPVARAAAGVLAGHSAIRAGWFRRLAGPPWTTFAWAAALATLAWVVLGKVGDPRWGAGPELSRFPARAARSIAEAEPPGRIFNHYEFGGYLAWTLGGRYQVFVDGRHFYNDRALAEATAIIEARPGWQTALDRYRINTIVIPALYYPLGKTLPLVPVLAADPGWDLVSTGPREMLFFRATVVTDLAGVRRLAPHRVWEQVAKEARDIIGVLPEQAPAYLSLADALLSLGEREQARDALRQYLRRNPRDAEAARRLARLEAHP